MGQLDRKLCAVDMDCITKALQACNIPIVVYREHMGCRTLRSKEESPGDDQRNPSAGPRRKIFRNSIGDFPIEVGLIGGDWSHHDTIPDLQPSDLAGFKQPI